MAGQAFPGFLLIGEANVMEPIRSIEELTRRNVAIIAEMDEAAANVRTRGERVADRELAVHHHSDGDSGRVDVLEPGRLGEALGSLPVHLVEPGTLVPGGLYRADLDDQPEPTGEAKRAPQPS